MVQEIRDSFEQKKARAPFMKYPPIYHNFRFSLSINAEISDGFAGHSRAFPHLRAWGRISGYGASNLFNMKGGCHGEHGRIRFSIARVDLDRDPIFDTAFQGIELHRTGRRSLLPFRPFPAIAENAGEARSGKTRIEEAPMHSRTADEADQPECER
jgi:hypothetical protein